jgi:hypothetical protein
MSERLTDEELADAEGLVRWWRDDPNIRRRVPGVAAIIDYADRLLAEVRASRASSPPDAAVAEILATVKAVMPDIADCHRAIERLSGPTGTCPPDCRGIKIEPYGEWSGCRCPSVTGEERACDCPQHRRLRSLAAPSDSPPARESGEGGEDPITRRLRERRAEGFLAARAEDIAILETAAGMQTKPDRWAAMREAADMLRALDAPSPTGAGTDAPSGTVHVDDGQGWRNPT